MMRTSWVNRKESIYYIFLILLLIHLGSLLIRLKVFETAAPPAFDDVNRTEPIKINLVPRAIDPTKRQIVQSEDGGVKKKMDDAYLGEKDRAFDRESVARKVDTFKKGAKSSGGSTAKKASPPKQLKLSDIGGVASAPHPLAQSAQEYTDAKNGRGKGSGVGDGDSKGPSRVVSSTNDHVEDVPLGDFTHLNTVEFKYYGFYHRIRQKLEQYWGRSIQEKAAQLGKAGRTVATSDEFITALEITLNKLGEIVSIRLIDTSGVKELDDAAVESFNEAGPFPNPPKGLVKNGRVTIEWGFVVNT